MKSGFVSVVGRTNAGKSTLVNALIGQKVAIVSNKPQTTRYRIMGVLNSEDTQIVFTDTPGIHEPRTELGRFMVGQASEALMDADLALLVVEPIDNVGRAEEKIIKSLEGSGIPVILVVNKIDTVKKEELLSVIGAYSNAYNFDAIIPLSAKKGDGISLLLEEINKYLQDGPMFFPEDMVTDSPIRQRYGEIIREKLLWALDKEVPHGIAIEVHTREETASLIKLDVTIYCEKRTHKGIIIGKGGEMIKTAGRKAREEIEAIAGKKVYLETWVKVKEGWRDNTFLLKNFGFEN